jgi:hypothetical protein
MVEKYRKKPVVIEAIQFKFGRAATISDWLGREHEGSKWCFDEPNQEFVIVTLEGKMRAKWDDFIIKGVKGEFYPCKPDIFEATYESAS